MPDDVKAEHKAVVAAMLDNDAFEDTPHGWRRVTWMRKWLGAVTQFFGRVIAVIYRPRNSMEHK